MKASMVFAAALVSAAVLCANAQESVPASDTSVVIKLSRTECFGECPVYQVEINGDGTVRYEGKKFVRVLGKQTAHIAAAQVADLVKDFYAIDFFNLKDSYETVTRPDGSVWSASDLPSATTSVTIGSRTKTVRDYYGTPEKLTALEHKIDKVANTQQWIFVDAATVRQWAASGWSREQGDRQGPAAARGRSEPGRWHERKHGHAAAGRSPERRHSDRQ